MVMIWVIYKNTTDAPGSHGDGICMNGKWMARWEEVANSWLKAKKGSWDWRKLHYSVKGQVSTLLRDVRDASS